MVYFVEQGNAFILDFGDINAAFYDVLILMDGSAVDQVLRLPAGSRRPFQQRLEAILVSALGIGWGYPDGLRDHYRRGFQQPSTGRLHEQSLRHR